jgi:hypothetical protein
MHQVNLAICGKGVYHTAVKVFNGLPYNHTEISNNPKKFKANLRDFLYSDSFYTLEELFTRRLFNMCKIKEYYYHIVILGYDFAHMYRFYIRWNYICSYYFSCLLLGFITRVLLCSYYYNLIIILVR